YEGGGTALLRGLEVRTPPADLGAWPECFVEAPGYPTKPHQPLPSLTFGEPWKRLESPLGHGCPGWLSGVFAIDNPSRNLAMVFWTWDEQESCGVSAVRCDAGTRVSHRVDLADRFRTGHRVSWEGAHVQLTHGAWRDALGLFHDWYDEIGFRVPADVPGWARTAHLYNCFVGYLPYADPPQYPDHDALIADLDRIEALGFDTVYTMPHVPYPGYDSEDYLDVEKQYGSADGVRRLAAACHDRGLKLMLDIGIHGVVDGELARIRQDFIAEQRFHDHPLPEVSHYRTKHPGFFMHTDTGKLAATYTWAFDHADQGWRDHMVEAMSLYVREFGADGFRIDAPTWVPFPDWTEGRPHRASASIYGSAKLFEQARAAIHRGNPDVVFYSEAPGPVFARGFDLFYDYDHQWLYSALLQPKSDKGYLYIAAFPDERISAADMAVWIEQLRLVKPRGTTSVHHLDSGDTFGWSNLQYRRQVFGVPAAKALFALVVSLGGPLMMYAHAEDGMEEFYRDILRMKRSLPAVDRGDIDCLAVGCDNDRVFAPLRTLETQVVVPVINIADRVCAATLALPVDRLGPGDAWIVMDRVDGTVIAGGSGGTWKRRDLTAVKVDLGPFQYRFLEVTRA
ncbi:MAG TPA: alpha-amylase family glycosyl hydrolase, partial [Desulfobacterales bacterium]|nr:alpha-amylase family glycosyl hydrolase [Desulfobacterales bacterium]